MAEELQSLLERIQQEGIEKADAESRRIVAEAGTKAAEIVRDAEAKGRSIVERAEQDAKAFEARAEKALRQASRDIILSTGEAVSALFRDLVAAEAASAMTGEAFHRLLAEVVRSYCESAGEGAAVDVIVSPAQREQVVAFFKAKCADILRDGTEIKADSGIISGFRVSVAQGQVEHDFTGDAITDAFCQLLRPNLAEILRKAQA